MKNYQLFDKEIVSQKVRSEEWFHILEKQLPISSKIIVTTHPDENQVQLDVQRSYGYIVSKNTKLKFRRILYDSIMSILCKYPTLHYYQGYHDIVAVFVQVFKNDIVQLQIALERFTLLYLRDFMTENMQYTLDQLQLIPMLVSYYDTSGSLSNNLKLVEPNFALSSILTIFSHQLKPNEETIFQIFDLVIATQSMWVPLLIYAHLIIYYEDQILEDVAKEQDNFDNLNDLWHVVLQKILLKDHEPQVWHQVLAKVNDEIRKGIKLPRCKFINSKSPLLTTARSTKFQRRGTRTYHRKISQGKMLELLSNDISDSNWQWKLGVTIGLVAIFWTFRR